MSRSRRKHFIVRPMGGSDAWFRRRQYRVYRRVVRQELMLIDPEAELLPELREYSNIYDWPSDGWKERRWRLGPDTPEWFLKAIRK